MENTETQIAPATTVNPEPTRVGSGQGGVIPQEKQSPLPHSFIKPKTQIEDSKSSMITMQESKAEAFIQSMEQCITDIATYKDLIEKNVNSEISQLSSYRTDTLEKIQSLLTATTELNGKIGNVRNYEEYLRSELEQDTLKRDKTSLELHLIEQENKITKFIQDMTTSTSNSIAKLSGEVTNANIAVKNVVAKLDVKITELKSVETVITESLQSFEKAVTDKVELIAPQQKELLNSLESKVEKLTSDTSQSFVDGSTNQFSKLKQQAEKMIDDYTKQCQKNLDTIKTESIEFLKSCQKQNNEIIKKIPYRDSGKYKLKDWILYAVCVCTLFFSVLLNFFRA